MTTPSAAAAIAAPAGYAAAAAIAFSAADGSATLVAATDPLPARIVTRVATSMPLSGTVGASGIVGPFVPELNRPIWVTLSGTWAGTATVLRSVDGGATLLPLTAGGLSWASFNANANEPVGFENEAAASYYVSFSLSSGTAGYRVAQ